MIHKTQTPDQAAELQVQIGRHAFGQGMKIYLILGVAFVIILLNTVGYI